MEEDPQIVFNPPYPMARIEREDTPSSMKFRPTGAPIRLDHSNQVQERPLVHDSFTSRLASYNAAKAFEALGVAADPMIIFAVVLLVVVVVAMMVKK